MIKLLTIEIEGDNPEQITFNIILGSNTPPILGSQYMSPQTKAYTTSTVTNKEYMENIHIAHGHIQTKQLTELLIQYIISVDLKELQPEYRKNGYRYILYIVDEFSKLKKGIFHSN